MPTYIRKFYIAKHNETVKDEKERMQMEIRNNKNKGKGKKG